MIDPVESRSRLAASLSPESTTALSCWIVTAPDDWNVSVPEVNVPAVPISIDEPLKLALPLTVSESSPVSFSVIAALPLSAVNDASPVTSIVVASESSSVIAPPLMIVSPPPATFAPAISVESSSVMLTAPADVNVNVPALNVSSIVIEVPLKSALLVTSSVVATVSSSVIDPVESRSRLAASLSPESTTALSC